MKQTKQTKQTKEQIKEYNKTYLFAKFGKSIKFNPKSWSGLGGDVEAPSLIRSFARNNPNDLIIIIGKNDLENCDIPEKNIISIQDYYKKKNNIKNNKELGFKYIFEELKDTKIDGVFILGGPVGSTNLPDTSYRRKEWEKEGKKIFAKCLECNLNYVAPLVYFLNKTKVPWLHILNDPRYKMIGRDCLIAPEICLSQYNEEIVYSHLDNFEDQNIVKEKRQTIYSGIEKMFLTHFDKFNDEGIEKDIKFLIVLNEGNNGVKSRYPELKKYVLDYIDDVEIYGKWDKKTIKDDERFKGSIPFIELQELIPRVKYSFIIPIKEGWVTMKFWEMILNGIIPFMHPDYDSQNNLKVPKFLRIKDPEELHKKIEYLEKNPEIYQKLLKELKSMITEDDFNGKNISKMLIKNAEKFKEKYNLYNKNKINFNLEQNTTLINSDSFDESEW